MSRLEDDQKPHVSPQGPMADDLQPAVPALKEPAKPRRAGQEPMPAPAPFQPRPPALMAAYMLAAALIALTQGLGLSLLSNNIQQVAGPLEATQVEATWLVTAYMIPNASLTLMLFKLRAQFGLRKFAEISILAYAAISLGHLWVDSFESALVLRFFAGAAAAPMSSLAFLYMLETVPPARKLNLGLCLALTALALPTPVAGLLSPALLDLGGWHAFYLLELGLALICLAAIYRLPLNSPPRAKVISLLDILSYGFLAVGLGAVAVVLTVGRLYWWVEAPWIGWLLVIGFASLTVMALIELNRRNQLLDIRWLTSREIVHFTGVLLVFRLILSEQSSGAIGMFRTMGLLSDQMQGLYLVILVASVVSGFLCALLMKPGREPAIHAAALIMLALGSYMDSGSTVLTRPEQVYVSQMLISFASGLFLPPALAIGFSAALKRGPNYVLSFIIVFLTTQKVGGYLGSALYGTFVQRREQFHSFRLVSRLAGSDPLVAARLQQYVGAYAKVTTDPLLRNAQGASLFSKQVQQQAYVLAYNDAFLLTALLALAALAVLVLHLLVRHRDRWLPGRPAPKGATATA